MQKDILEYTDESFQKIQTLLEIENYLNKGGSINALDIYGQTLLTQQISDASVLDYLLKNGIDVNINNCYGENALFFNNDICILKKLIDAGCSISQKNDFKDYPIYKSVQNKEIFSLYIEAGFDVNAEDFWIFEYNPCAEVLEYAIERGLDLNRKDKENAINLIGDFELAQCYVKHNKEFLAQQGIIKNAYVFEQELKKGKISDNVFSLYLSAGLDPKNWLYMNLSLKKIQSVNKYFSQRLFTYDDYGNNLLMNYFCDDMIIFDYLLSRGLDINHKNNKNKSVLHLLHHWEGAEYLIERGAFIYEDWHNYENSMLAEKLNIYKLKQEKEKLADSIKVSSVFNNKRL